MAPRGKKIIIDTDPGVDDSWAILLALRSPEVEVIGLTSLFGNVRTKMATQNALYLLEKFGKTDIPVVEGSLAGGWVGSRVRGEKRSRVKDTRYPFFYTLLSRLNTHTHTHTRNTRRFTNERLPSLSGPIFAWRSGRVEESVRRTTRRTQHSLTSRLRHLFPHTGRAVTVPMHFIFLISFSSFPRNCASLHQVARLH